MMIMVMVVEVVMITMVMMMQGGNLPSSCRQVGGAIVLLYCHDDDDDDDDVVMMMMVVVVVEEVAMIMMVMKMQLMTYDNDYDDYDDYDDNHDDHDDDHVDDDAGSTYLQAVDRCAPLFPNSLFHITIMVVVMMIVMVLVTKIVVMMVVMVMMMVVMMVMVMMLMVRMQGRNLPASCVPLFPNSLFHITIMVALSSYIAPNNICPSYTSIAFFQSKHCCGGGKGSTLQLAAWRMRRKVLLPINLDQKICKLSAEILLLGKLLTCSSDAHRAPGSWICSVCLYLTSVVFIITLALSLIITFAL